MLCRLGKGIFTYVSDNFDEPLDDFKEYNAMSFFIDAFF